MFSRSHRSRNTKAQGLATDQEAKAADAQRSLLSELGLLSSSSSTARFGGRSAKKTDVDRRAYDYASSTASARTYGISSYPEKSKAPTFRTAALPHSSPSLPSTPTRHLSLHPSCIPSVAKGMSIDQVRGHDQERAANLPR